MDDNPSAPASILRAMAERVERNDPDEFAGCVVIIPPASEEHSSGEPIEILLIDPARDLANFWATATTKMRAAADEFQAQQQVPQIGGYR